MCLFKVKIQYDISTIKLSYNLTVTTYTHHDNFRVSVRYWQVLYVGKLNMFQLEQFLIEEQMCLQQNMEQPNRCTHTVMSFHVQCLVPSHCCGAQKIQHVSHLLILEFHIDWLKSEKFSSIRVKKHTNFVQSSVIKTLILFLKFAACIEASKTETTLDTLT